MRTEELTRLDTVKHINANKGTLYVNAAKGSNDRLVPLDDEFIKHVQQMFNGPVLNKFNRSKLTFKRELARRFDKFKLKTLGYGYRDLTLHGLRAAFAQAVYVNCDNDIMLVKDLLGHKWVSTTTIYMTGLNFTKKHKQIRGSI